MFDLNRVPGRHRLMVSEFQERKTESRKHVRVVRRSLKEESKGDGRRIN